MTAQDKVTGRSQGQIWHKAEAVLSLPAGTGAVFRKEWLTLGPPYNSMDQFWLLQTQREERDYLVYILITSPGPEIWELTRDKLCFCSSVGPLYLQHGGVSVSHRQLEGLIYLTLIIPHCRPDSSLNGLFFKEMRARLSPWQQWKTNAIHRMAVRLKKGATHFWGQAIFHDVTKNRSWREQCQLLTF